MRVDNSLLLSNTKSERRPTDARRECRSASLRSLRLCGPAVRIVRRARLYAWDRSDLLIHRFLAAGGVLDGIVRQLVALDGADGLLGEMGNVVVGVVFQLGQ